MAYVSFYRGERRGTDLEIFLTLRNSASSALKNIGNEVLLGILEPITNMAYQCAASTRWAVDIRGIALANQETGVTCFLKYPQAAIWDLIARNYPYAHIIRMLEAITLRQEAEVLAILRESLDTWVKNGFLTTEHTEYTEMKK